MVGALHKMIKIKVWFQNSSKNNYVVHIVTTIFEAATKSNMMWIS